MSAVLVPVYGDLGLVIPQPARFIMEHRRALFLSILFAFLGALVAARLFVKDGRCRLASGLALALAALFVAHWLGQQYLVPLVFLSEHFGWHSW
jgi:hypothetical protein